jgi:trimeric autotransporter adhesin
MKQLIKLKTIPLLLTPLALACFALLPSAQAATPENLPAPPPDGGYAGFNTAEGLNALKNVNTATGVFNTALGFNALSADTTGAHNTAVGGQALLNNNGSFNTAVGENALVFNTEGSMNMALGQGALANNTSGSSSVAMGFQALNHNTSGHDNSAVGSRALFKNDLGQDNTAIGNGALGSNIHGSASTAVGFLALAKATTIFSTIGSRSNGGDTAVGYNALPNVTTGGGDIGLGFRAGANVTTADNVIVIGSLAGQNVSNSCFIDNIFGSTSSGGAGVVINSAGKLGTSTSSRRFKDDIRPMERASETLFAFQPVTFRYKKDIDPQGTAQFGLVAEDVEKINPDLVVRDAEGKPYSVRYDAINAMLLNEFLKAHRKMEQQEATIAKQQKQIDALAAGLQKVSAQLETSRPAKQVAENSQ